MCGRYTLYEIDDLSTRFNARVATTAPMKPNYNVAPTKYMPVVTLDGGQRYISLMHWGIPRIMGHDKVREIINTRADKAFGGFWRKTVTQQRCLVPANGFYEWIGPPGDKTPYYIHPKDQRLFAFAGIWSHWSDKEGKDFNAYSIMTTEPNSEMKAIHDRMPVILFPDEEADWLDKDHSTQDELEQYLHPYQDNGLDIFEVSREVNVVKNNYGELITPINTA